MTDKVFYHDDSNNLRVFEKAGAAETKVRTSKSDISPSTRGPSVQKSNLKKAGNGLFADKDYGKGAVVTKYGGALLSDSQVKRSASKYVMTDDHGKHHDSRLVSNPDKEKGRWINDPKGSSHEPNVEAITTNSGILIKTKRAIKSGEEFYLDYGDRYWG